MKILMIEDDDSVAKSIELSMATAGITCDITETGIEGIELGKTGDYDLVILDLMLPDINGYEVLSSLRTDKITTPVLILSALSTIDEKIKGLGFGADDYLTKPFNNAELLARIKSLVRRSKGHANSVIQFGNVVVNLDSRTVQVNEKKITLTSKEYAIIELLTRRKGSVLTKKMFLSHLYDGLPQPKIKIIDVFICKLRNKLKKAAGVDYIKTVWGRGYMIQG